MYDKRDTDYVHRCTSQNLVLDEEDVLKLGNYIDEGTGQEVAVRNPYFQGSANKLWGRRAAHIGERHHTLTDRGNIKQLYRQRQHFEYIKIKK